MSDSRKFTLDLWGSLCFRLGVSVDLACSGTSCRCSVVLGSVESGGRVNTLSSLACSLLSSLWQAWQGGVSLLCDVRLIIVWVCVVCQSNPRFASKTLASKFQISVVQFTYTVVLLLTVQWLIKKKKKGETILNVLSHSCRVIVIRYLLAPHDEPECQLFQSSQETKLEGQGPHLRPVYHMLDFQWSFRHQQNMEKKNLQEKND